MRKAGIGKKIVIMALAAVFAAGTYQPRAEAFEWGYEDVVQPTGNVIFDAFIQEPDYESGAEWALSQKPKIANSGSSGCCAYCADFVKYCYGLNTPTSKDSYKDPSQIRAGDVIHLKSPGSGHWVAVLKRDGNMLYTAEGNWGSVCRVGWNYWIDDNEVYGSRHSFDIGYHFVSAATGGSWSHDGNKWKYTYNNGFYAVNEWVKDNGVWYYIGEDGYMLTGWQLLDGVWYYLNPSGAMQKNWKKIGGIWYYFAGSGAMAKGWRKVNGVWYYFSGGGAMQTGWKEIGGTTYYFEPSGAMVTGTVVIDGEEYFFDDNGAMK